MRDNLTSYTQTKLVPSENKDDLRSGLVCLIYPIKLNMSSVVRVDPHSSFRALKDDKHLQNMGIFLEVGQEKNSNKNGVAEKAIQELEEEIKKLEKDTNQLDDISLAKATFSLNSRIRHTKRSAKELLIKRDQFHGGDLSIQDEAISDLQYARRKKDNSAKMPKDPPE